MKKTPSSRHPFGTSEGIALEFKNPNVPHYHGRIEAERFTPFPKNPTICKFMIQIGRYEELGSGVRKVNKYLPHYAPGAEKPVFDDGDMFTVTVPLGTSVATASDHENEQVNPGAGEQVGAKSALSRHQVDILRKCQQESALLEIMTISGRSDRTKFRRQVMNPLLIAGLLELTIPDKMRSSKQKYWLTDKGRNMLEKEKQNE